MKGIKAAELLEKYQLGLCTEEESALIETWYLKHQVSHPVELSPAEHLTDIHKIWHTLAQRTDPVSRIEPVVTVPVKKYKMWYRNIAAAAIFLVIGTGVCYFNFWSAKQDFAQQDIPAGSNRAILTLANGRKINLTNATKGKLAEEAGVNISKTANGQIVYHLRDTGLQPGSNVNPAGLNIISTPRGGQYEIDLPDGSRVWLNASSSLKYPSTFTHLKERKVELNGEAYFEVHHNSHQPFKVQTIGQSVEDIGTEFNISSYSDEMVVKTTLVSGAAAVSPLRGQSRVLIAGQESILKKSGVFNVQTADIQEAVAWKNGDFVFRKVDFRTVMRKIARWYDVEVIYDPSAPDDIPLGGVISRSKNISVLLNLMEETGAVHFKIEGRRITVSK